jgi:hypothetical protein
VQVLGIYKEMLLRIFEYFAAGSNEKGSRADDDMTQVSLRARMHSCVRRACAVLRRLCCVRARVRVASASVHRVAGTAG